MSPNDQVPRRLPARKDAIVLPNPRARPRRCYWNVINFMVDHKMYLEPQWEMVGGYYGPEEFEHFWIADRSTGQYFEVSLHASNPPYREDAGVKRRWDARVEGVEQ